MPWHDDMVNEEQDGPTFSSGGLPDELSICGIRLTADEAERFERVEASRFSINLHRRGLDRLLADLACRPTLPRRVRNRFHVAAFVAARRQEGGAA